MNVLNQVDFSMGGDIVIGEQGKNLRDELSVDGWRGLELFSESTRMLETAQDIDVKCVDNTVECLDLRPR